MDDRTRSAAHTRFRMHLHYRRKFSENPVDSSENYDVESQVAKYMNDSLVYRIRVRVDLLNGCGIEPGHVLQAWLDLNGRRLLYVASKRFEQNLKALRAMVPDQLSVSEVSLSTKSELSGVPVVKLMTCDFSCE